MYWANFKRALGIRPGFRRSSASAYFNMAVAAGVGVISGHYIFKQPLEEYWREQHKTNLLLQQDQQQQQQQQQNGKHNNDTTA
jgi:hypothetical protein